MALLWCSITVNFPEGTPWGSYLPSIQGDATLWGEGRRQLPGLPFTPHRRRPFGFPWGNLAAKTFDPKVDLGHGYNDLKYYGGWLASSVSLTDLGTKPEFHPIYFLSCSLCFLMLKIQIVIHNLVSPKRIKVSITVLGTLRLNGCRSLCVKHWKVSPLYCSKSHWVYYFKDQF